MSTSTRQSLLVLFALAQAALVLSVGLAGETLRTQLGLDTLTYVLVTSLFLFVLLAASVRMLGTVGRSDDDVALTFPVHWSSFFSLGTLVGLLIGALLVRLLGGDIFAGAIHTYEVAGLALGMLVLLLMAVRRTPIPGAAFGLGYGLALPSAILFFDPQNDLVLTYVGHFVLMSIAGILLIVFTRVVRIQIVD